MAFYILNCNVLLEKRKNTRDGGAGDNNSLSVAQHDSVLLQGI